MSSHVLFFCRPDYTRLRQIERLHNDESFAKCLCVHFNDKVHNKDCQTVGTDRSPHLQSQVQLALHFSLQNPFSIRARCSKDPEFLAVCALGLTSQGKWKHEAGRRQREAVQREKRLLIFSFLIADYCYKSCIFILIVLFRPHLFSKSGRDRKLSSSEKMTWHFSFCLALKKRAVKPHEKKWKY